VSGSTTPSTTCSWFSVYGYSGGLSIQYGCAPIWRSRQPASKADLGWAAADEVERRPLSSSLTLRATPRRHETVHGTVHFLRCHRSKPQTDELVGHGSHREVFSQLKLYAQFASFREPGFPFWSVTSNPKRHSADGDDELQFCSERAAQQLYAVVS